MRAAFKTASAYLSMRSLVVIGRLHKKHAGKGNVFIECSERLKDKFGELPKKHLADHAGQIDLSMIYGGYYDATTALAAFDHRQVDQDLNSSMISLDTFVSITSAADSIYELDTKPGEVAIVICGENARLIYHQLELGKKCRRPLGNEADIAIARNFIRRRLRLFSLIPATRPTDDVAGLQPNRELSSQQMFAEETKRYLPDQMI